MFLPMAQLINDLSEVCQSCLIQYNILKVCMNNFRFIKISKDYQCNKLTKFPHILLYLYLVIAYILTSSLSSYSVNQLFNQAAETARERPPYQLYYSHTHVPNRLYESNICCVSRLLLFVYININFERSHLHQGNYTYVI